MKDILVREMENPDSGDMLSGSGEETAPYVILMVGVNGVGKTTSIAKLAHHFEQTGKRVILGAGDTFRAAASEQLQILGERVGVDVISPRLRLGPRRGGLRCVPGRAGQRRGHSNHRHGGTAAHQVKPDGRAQEGGPGVEAARPFRAPPGDPNPGCDHRAQRTHQAKAFKEAVDCTGIFLANWMARLAGESHWPSNRNWASQ